MSKVTKNHKLPSLLSEIYLSSRMKPLFKKIVVVKIVLIAIAHLFDLIKDSLILKEISISQGGIRELMKPQRPQIIRWVRF